MPSLRPIFLLILSLFALAVVSVSDQEPSNQQIEHFQALLADVAESDIHQVLHDWSNRFKDGVFHRDRTAIEAVHSENAAIATELVKLAKGKRATSNTTTVTSSSTSSTTTTTSTTSTNIRTSVIPPTSPAGASIVSSSSDAVVFSDSNGLTTAHSSTAVVAVSPSSTTLLLTTTLPGGSHSTITSTVVVDAAYTTLSTDTAVAAESGSATGTPSLQSGATANTKEYLHGAIGVVAGVMAVALA